MTIIEYQGPHQSRRSRHSARRTEGAQRGASARPAGRWRAVCAAAVVALGLMALPGTAAAQLTLAVQGDHFTVNGQAKFLAFISYFDGLDSANSTADLQYLRSQGFDGVRIFPNWWTVAGQTFAGDTLIRPDGTLDPDTVQRFHWLLTAAQQQGMLVDMSFSVETVSAAASGSPTLSMAGLVAGLQRAAQEFAGYRGVLFDLQNESDINRPLQNPGVPNRQGFTEAELVMLRNAVKAVDPGRIVTASVGGGTAQAVGRAQRTAQDVVSWHDPRVASFASDTTAHVQALRGFGGPVYFQEPPKTSDVGQGPDAFRLAIANAKRAGAAAWCYHHRESHTLNGTTLPQTLEPSSRDFVTSFRSVLDATPWGAILARKIQLQTIQNRTWMVAEQGGGGAVNANRTVPSIWETFEIIDLNGGDLVTGDPVALRTFDGIHYLQATGSGGSSVNATPTAIGPWETFIIFKQNGGSRIIFEGDWVALQVQSGHYIVAENGGGSVVNANRVAIGPWETFAAHFP
jgi:hypothetical protein